MTCPLGVNHDPSSNGPRPPIHPQPPPPAQPPRPLPAPAPSHQTRRLPLLRRRPRPLALFARRRRESRFARNWRPRHPSRPKQTLSFHRSTTRHVSITSPAIAPHAHVRPARRLHLFITTAYLHNLDFDPPTHDPLARAQSTALPSAVGPRLTFHLDAHRRRRSEAEIKLQPRMATVPLPYAPYTQLTRPRTTKVQSYPTPLVSHLSATGFVLCAMAAVFRRPLVFGQIPACGIPSFLLLVKPMNHADGLAPTGMHMYVLRVTRAATHVHKARGLQETTSPFSR